MSFANFKPEIWSDKLLMDRDAKAIALPGCWRQWEGDIKNAGDRVHIQGLTGATIKDLPVSGSIDDAEEIDGDSLDLVIDQKKYINFKVQNIDKIQSNADATQSIISKTAANYALMQDGYIYGLCRGAAGAANTVDATASGKELTSQNAFSYLSAALAMLGTNSVAPGDVRMEVHPYVFQKLALAMLVTGTPNADQAKNGLSGNVLGVQIFQSPSLPVTDASGAAAAPGAAGAIYWSVVRTGEAVAFAEQKAIDFRPYDVEKGFADGIKGFGLYGAKVVKPKELVLFKSKLGTETTI